MPFLQKRSYRLQDLTKLLVLISLFIGISLMLSGYYINYSKRVLSFNVNIQTPENLSKIIAADYSRFPKRIVIEDLGIDVEVVKTFINDGVWEIPDDSAAFLTASARPGENSNIVIYGHNKANILGKLIGNVKVGQEIIIITTDYKAFRYLVTEVLTVKPEDVSVVMPTDNEVLTLYTCTGFLDSLRLIVKAVPVSL